jgi:hypothetical protein
MKRIIFSIVALALVCAWAASAASVDGKWAFESKLKGGKKGGEVTVKTVLDLKAEGGTLSGKVSSNRGKRGMNAEITDGKIDGNSMSFTTTMQGRKGAQKLLWKATLEGDELKGTQTREGGKRGQPFTAKRS